MIRVAWIGNPTPDGGVGGFCRQLICLLLGHGVDLTVFTTVATDECQALVGVPGGRCKIISEVPAWKWNKWYSSHPMTIFISSFRQRSLAHKKLIKRLLDEHSKLPFDVVVQFSQGELLTMRSHLKQLPPVLLFPCVHAAGELYWHRKEQQLALQTERRLNHFLVRFNLWYRSMIQKRSYQSAYGVIGMSKRFNELVRRDYKMDGQKQSVVYQPHDEIAHEFEAENVLKPPGMVQLLFVGRISVRKGVEKLVELSHAISDLEGVAQITIVGGPSFWSNYSGLLSGLNPATSRYLGPQSNQTVRELMRQSDALLVPSHYEPGGIVVAEALSAGCHILASYEVGSAEPLGSDCCTKFDSSSIAAFTRCVREFVSKRRALTDFDTREAHRVAAKAAFNPEATAGDLLEALTRAAARQPLCASGDPPATGL